MTDGMLWLGLVGMMAMTVLTRSGLIVWPGPINLPPRVQRALRYAPMAAIAAVILPSVLFDTNGAWVGVLNPQPLSALAFLIAWRLTRQMAACLIVGVMAYALIKFFL